MVAACKDPGVEICRISATEALICGLFILYNANVMNGTIKTMTDKGFGFITPEGGDKDVFFHQSALVDVQYNDLKVGDAVTFETEDSPKGPRAANVQKA
ncbi:MAG: hypothetical protein RL272_650 [Candidatus Parcubacteria bacterium]